MPPFAHGDARVIMETNSIYLDSNASTPVLPAVWEAMRPYMGEVYGNPASSHRLGQQARRALEDARERTAALLGAHADEVIFTSGATEANNLAIFGLAGNPPGHFLSSPLEHPCVSEPLRRLADRGFTHDLLPVSREGLVAADLATYLKPQTRLLCVMLANHEMGAIQPIADLAVQLPKEIFFHCDAAAAAGKIPISFQELAVTTLAISAHKFHGPKGIGALLARRQTPLTPLLWGGNQQQGRRPGTEPVALAVGLATALGLALANLEAHRARIVDLRHRFLAALQAGAAPVVLNGPVEGGIPHTLNLSFPGCSADALLMNLDLAGVACSTGSACSSGSLLPSPVLQSLSLPPEILQSALRFSFHRLLTPAETEEAARRIINVVNRLRHRPST